MNEFSRLSADPRQARVRAATAPLARAFGAFALGAATVSGFAPFDWFPVPFLTLALLVALWLASPDVRQSWLLGFAFGLGLFGVGASWVYVSLHDYGGMPAALTVFVTLMFCAVLALFPAFTGYLQARLAGNTLVRVSVAIPAAWLLTEWLRGWIFTGFPWLSLGYSQVPASPLGGYAPVLGIYGVSVALLLCAGTLALSYHQRQARWLLGFVAVLALGWLLQRVAWTQPAGAPTSVALLQGNVSQDIKFREEMLPRMLASYLDLARASNAKLIILPESAFPIFRHELPEEYLALLSAHARGNGGDLLYGIFEYAAKTRSIYNTVMSTGTSAPQTYRKHHLVAFGEFIPLKALIGWVYEDVLNMPLADQTAGAALQAPMNVAGQKIAVDICYEDAFGAEIIRPLPAATLLVNVSNDGWFGRSLGPQQHLQIAQARALETGRYLLRATNTGVTAIIDARGVVLQRAPEFQTTTLSGSAQGYSGTTPYVRWGNYPIVGLGLLALLASWWRTRPTREKMAAAPDSGR